VCDAGSPRNAASHGLHGFLTRDGTPPLPLLRIGRRELARYGVELRKTEVVAASRKAGRFIVRLKNGTELTCRGLYCVGDASADVQLVIVAARKARKRLSPSTKGSRREI
jgi:thioredoxin reductase